MRGLCALGGFRLTLATDKSRAARPPVASRRGGLDATAGALAYLIGTGRLAGIVRRGGVQARS